MNLKSIIKQSAILALAGLLTTGCSQRLYERGHIQGKTKGLDITPVKPHTEFGGGIHFNNPLLDITEDSSGEETKQAVAIWNAHARLAYKNVHISAGMPLGKSTRVVELYGLTKLPTTQGEETFSGTRTFTYEVKGTPFLDAGFTYEGIQIGFGVQQLDYTITRDFSNLSLYGQGWQTPIEDLMSPIQTESGTRTSYALRLGVNFPTETDNKVALYILLGYDYEQGKIVEQKLFRGVGLTWVTPIHIKK
jgi:hypothetical protein